MRVCVIGGGHNGLVAANVLAEAGVEVEVFEARNVPGGLADSREFKGVKVSRASYVLGLMPSSLVKKFGIPTIKQDPFQTLFVDGKVYPFWREPEKRRKELLTRGLELFPEFDRKLLEFKKMIDEEFTFLDSPPSMEDVKEEAKRRGVEEIMELSSGKFLERYLPKELHRAFIYPGMYDSPAYLVAYFYSPQWSVVPGGMGTIGKILAQRAQSLGAKLRLGNLVSRIEAEGGRIKWIESGRKKFQFDAVISATSPLVTWKLIGEAPKVQSMRPHWVKYNMVFREIPKLPEALKPFYASILDIEAGELLFHSASDDSLGGIVASFMGSLEELYELIPDIKEKIIGIDLLDSKEAETEYYLPGGDLNHLPMKVPYLFDGRPGYRTEFQGLYMGSAGSYPGGQVTGIPGFNAAQALLKDMGIK